MHYTIGEGNANRLPMTTSKGGTTPFRSVASRPSSDGYRWVYKNKTKEGVCTIFIDDVIHKTKCSQPIQKPKPTGCWGYVIFHI